MMNISKSLLCGVCLALALMATSAFAADDNIRQLEGGLVELVVVGQGLDKEEAMRDAHRKAVERGAGTYIYSQSKTRDFVLVKDTILARSTGYVQSREVLDEKQEEDGVWSLRVKAVVSIKGIKDAWGVTVNLLRDMGRPKIMVYIREKIDDKHVEISTVQTRIENLLIKSGFMLVSRKQLEALDAKELSAAKLEGDTDKIRAIAKRFGAQLLLTGTASATQTGARRVGGVSLYTYDAEANVTCYRSDSANLLVAIPGKSTRGVQRSPGAASKQALDNQGAGIAPLVREDILRYWQDALEGRNEVTLEVSNVAKFISHVKLKRALNEVKGIKAVTGKLNNGISKYSIECNTTAEKLAERIAEKLDKTLEVTDISQNTIKATLISK